MEMASAEDANSALMLNGQKLMGRPIKLALAPPRPSDKWPPAETEVTAGGGGTAKEEDDGGNPDEVVPPRSEKPSECVPSVCVRCVRSLCRGWQRQAGDGRGMLALF